MTTEATRTAAAAEAAPTIWGLSPVQVHDRFWASRAVQVVRCGEPTEIVASAELFLLLDPGSLVLFRLRDLIEDLSWLKPDLLVVRLRGRAGQHYRERGCREAADACPPGVSPLRVSDPVGRHRFRFVPKTLRCTRIV